MYRVPKIKRFSTITEQSQQSWRSNLSSESKRHIFLQDISQNLLLLKEDLVNFFENNKDYLFPTENEEYISLNTSSIIVSPEELLYRLIDIIKSNDFIYRLEEASTTITSLSKQLDEVKSDLRKYIKKSNHEDSLSSFRSDYHGTISQDLINKLKEKNMINKKIIKDYDNLVDEYIMGLTQKSAYEAKIQTLENNLKDYNKTKILNDELTINNKQMNDEIFLNRNEISELKRVNNKLYEENIKNLLEDNNNGNLEFVFDEMNDKLKIIYKGELITTIAKFKKEIAASFLSRKKYHSINSNIHPPLSEIRRNNSKNINRQMTISNNHKVCEINNFNITYKLSQNEYDIDCSNSGHNKNSTNSKGINSSICLDKLCQDISDSGATNQPSSQKSKSKSIKKNNLKKYEDNLFKSSHDLNQKRLRRSMTDFKIGKRLNKNISKIQSFGIDVESIKEEKDEDNISLFSFDCKINSKKRSNSEKKQKSKELSQVSSFLETDSFIPVKKNEYKFIINCVENFSIKRKYCYPNNVKLNLKKINIKRIIPSNKNEEQSVNSNDESEKCQIF